MGEARANGFTAMECLMSLIRPESNTETAYIRGCVGALIIVDLANDIRILRKAYTTND